MRSSLSGSTDIVLLSYNHISVVDFERVWSFWIYYHGQVSWHSASCECWTACWCNSWRGFWDFQDFGLIVDSNLVGITYQLGIQEFQLRGEYNLRLLQFELLSWVRLSRVLSSECYFFLSSFFRRRGWESQEARIPNFLHIYKGSENET